MLNFTNYIHYIRTYYILMAGNLPITILIGQCILHLADDGIACALVEWSVLFTTFDFSFFWVGKTTFIQEKLGNIKGTKAESI